MDVNNETKEFTYNKNVNKNININKTSHNRYTNDADVIRAKNEYNEGNRDFKQVLILWGAIFGIIIAIIIGISLPGAIAKEQGKIKAGECGDLIGEDYKAVVAHFEAAGFTNIEIIDLNDSGIAFWTEGKVKKISVGGDTNFDSDDWFEPDTKVIISYH